ncbi:MAG TPA: hypothetical protein VEA38_00230 [Terriglobales bacterium]|nr:hypothetical protein [Terriglobales bacterium]
MRLRYFLPLLAHLVPTLVIGFGSVIPGSCIDGLNPLTIGFAASIAGTCLAYVGGLWAVLRDRPQRR